MINRFKITAGLGVADSKVELNGKELDGVVRVSFDLSAANQPTVLKLEIIGEIVVEGEFVERVIAESI